MPVGDGSGNNRGCLLGEIAVAALIVVLIAAAKLLGLSPRRRGTHCLLCGGTCNEMVCDDHLDGGSTDG